VEVCTHRHGCCGLQRCRIQDGLPNRCWRGPVSTGTAISSTQCQSEEAERLAYKWLYMMTRAFVDDNGVVVEKYKWIDHALWRSEGTAHSTNLQQKWASSLGKLSLGRGVVLGGSKREEEAKGSPREFRERVLYNQNIP